MKKFLFAAVFVAICTVPAWCQYTDMEDAEDSTVVMVSEDYIPELTNTERSELKSLLNENAATNIVYDDNSGCIIYKSANKKYNYLNVRTQQKILFKDMDNIELVDITGCDLEDGVAVTKDCEIGVYTLKGDLLIPMVPADSLITVVKNPFKTNSHSTWGYAIMKRDDELYAVDTKGIPYILEMDECAFGVNIILGYKGDNVYVYTPDGSTEQEFVFNASEKDTEFVEVEILETSGAGRYEYDDAKYANISPGLVVKKGLNYTLYPGGQKLSVHKNAGLMIGKAGTKKVIFTPKYDKATQIKPIITAWAEAR